MPNVGPWPKSAQEYRSRENIVQAMEGIGIRHAHENDATGLERFEVLLNDGDILIEKMFDEPCTPHEVETLRVRHITTVAFHKLRIPDFQPALLVPSEEQRLVRNIETDESGDASCERKR